MCVALIEQFIRKHLITACCSQNLEAQREVYSAGVGPRPLVLVAAQGSTHCTGEAASGSRVPLEKSHGNSSDPSVFILKMSSCLWCALGWHLTERLGPGLNDLEMTSALIRCLFFDYCSCLPAAGNHLSETRYDFVTV